MLSDNRGFTHLEKKKKNRHHTFGKKTYFMPFFLILCLFMAAFKVAPSGKIFKDNKVSEALLNIHLISLLLQAKDI